MNLNLDYRLLVKVGTVVGAISAIVTATYSAFAWADDRWAKNSDLAAVQSNTCRQIENLSLQMTKTKIFELEVKKAETNRATPQQRRASPSQYFSAVDEAVLNRLKQDQDDVNERLKACTQPKK